MRWLVIEIKRWYHGDCTLGRLKLGSFQCFTLELPWLNNTSKKSCIPEGEYQYETYQSPKHGDVLLLKNVPDRTFIEVHAGNYTRQILGCILPGEGILFMDSDTIPDVSSSGDTLKKILALAGNSGTIKIYS